MLESTYGKNSKQVSIFPEHWIRILLQYLDSVREYATVNGNVHQWVSKLNPLVHPLELPGSEVL